MNHTDPQVETHSVDLAGSAPDVPITGMNGALRRLPKVDASGVPLIGNAGFVPKWRPYWQKPKTISLTFPDGLEFLPP